MSFYQVDMWPFLPRSLNSLWPECCFYNSERRQSLMGHQYPSSFHEISAGGTAQLLEQMHDFFKTVNSEEGPNKLE